MHLPPSGAVTEVVDHREEADVNAVKPSKILVPTDFSEGAACAFPYASALARRHRSELVLLHVVTGHSDYVTDNERLGAYEETILEDARSRMAELRIGVTEAIPVRREVAAAWSATAGILSFAERERPDLIVISTHGHRLVAQVLLGSVARGVIGSALCPALCVRGDHTGMLDAARHDVAIQRVLVPSDLSERSRMALRVAIECVRHYGAQLHLMYVVHVDVPPELLVALSKHTFELDDETLSHIDTRLQALQREVDPEIDKVVTLVDKGSPAKRIAAYASARRVDLIVVSRKGLGNTPHVLGGVVERLLHDAPCPMLVV